MPPIICLFCIFTPAGPFDQPQFQLPREPLACDYWPCTPIPVSTRQLWLLNPDTGIVIDRNHPILIVKKRGGRWHIVTIYDPGRPII